MINPAQAKDLAKAVHGRLAGHTGIHAVLGDPPRLYDSPPEDPVFPYLTYGDMRSEDLSGDGIGVMTHAFSLHLWSRYAGRSEVLDCVTLVAGALSSEPLPLEGGEVGLPIILYTDVLRAADGRTLHGLIRVKCHVQTPEALS